MIKNILSNDIVFGFGIDWSSLDSQLKIYLSIVPSLNRVIRSVRKTSH